MNIRIVGSSSIAALMVAGLLALGGCTETTSVTSTPSGTSGSGLPPPATPPVPGGSVAVNGVKVQLLVASPQLPSAGGATNTVNLTAVVLDQAGQALASRAVTFSTGNDPSAFISGISGGAITDSNGQVTAKLNLGANKSNRTIIITITDTVSTASATNIVGVTGTSITVTGTASLQFGSSTSLTFALKDSAGTAIPGSPITFASQAGNAIAPSSTNTDALGQITAVVTATQTAISDVVTATGGGTSKTQTLNVSTASFAFTAPASSIDIPLGAATSLNINWTFAGAPQNGQQVTFSTSRGTITGNPATVNVTGDTPGVSIVSNVSAGSAIITAQGQGNPGPVATLNVNFVAVTAASVSVQANPGVIKVTANPANPNQTDNVSTLTVTVRDGNNNPVKNASVQLDNAGDTSGGSLPSNTAITDANGSALLTYIAGQNGNPAVTITATVDKVNGVPIPQIQDTTIVTVGGQSLFVRLGTDNFVQTLPAPDPDLQKTWSAIVTDAGGNAIPGQQVRFTLIPTQYKKGVFVFDDTAALWLESDNTTVPPVPSPAQICPSEDNGGSAPFTAPPGVNVPGNANNGIVDPNEDVNGNGTLQPGNVASVNGTATTDANGIAFATITYPKNYAHWTVVQLQASAATVGNEPPTTATFVLPGLASDFTSKTVPPPGQISPFGTVQNCTNPN